MLGHKGLKIALGPGLVEDVDLDVVPSQGKFFLSRVERRVGIGSRRARRGHWSRCGEINLRTVTLGNGFNRNDLRGSGRAADLQ